MVRSLYWNKAEVPMKVEHIERAQPAGGCPQRGWRLFAKRLIDVCVASLALVSLAPLMLFLAGVVRVRLGSPVLFRQRRPGFRGRIFEVLKFRTMTDKRDSSGRLLPDEDRLTRLGLFLRSTSLDELPQLVNVLKGDLSLVGPRPLLVQYLERYTPEQARRHEVVPGITGWSQVNGRNAISWGEKFDMDVWYVDHWSLVLDIKIIFLTIFRVISRHGISDGASLTTKEFMGSRTENHNPESSGKP